MSAIYLGNGSWGIDPHEAPHDVPTPTVAPQAEAPAAGEPPPATDADADAEALLDFLRAVIRREVRQALEERGL